MRQPDIPCLHTGVDARSVTSRFRCLSHVAYPSFTTVQDSVFQTIRYIKLRTPSLPLASPSVPPTREPCTLSSKRGPIPFRHLLRSLWIASLLRLLRIRLQDRPARYARRTTSLQFQPSTKAAFGHYKWFSSPFGLACVGLATRLALAINGLLRVCVLFFFFLTLIYRIAGPLPLLRVSV